jgi:hypothetical protein
MDVAEFSNKVDLKILLLAQEYNNEVSEVGESCLWEDAYLLSEAKNIVNDELTSTECINNIISALDCKYRLSDLVETGEVGIGEMTIDASSGCNVFTVYE